MKPCEPPIPSPTADFASRLIAWQTTHGRHDLPWQHGEPYGVWVSEIMLQQTQVRVVIPYFERFVAALPDLATLAAAPPDRVLALWSGLGYYSRARNLQRAAQLCLERHDGELPRDIDALAALELPVALETAGQIGADAARDTRALRNFRWPLTEVLKAGAQSGGEAGDRANTIWKALQEAVSIPGRSLSDELTAAETKLVNWVVEREPATPPPPPPPPPPTVKERDRVLRTTDDLAGLQSEITEALQDSGKKVLVRWWLE